MKLSPQWLRRSSAIALGVAAIVANGAMANPAPSPNTAAADEAGAQAVFDRVAGDQSRLRVFVQAMPKGANLHNHLDGSVYAETYIDMAAEKGFCADFDKARIAPPPCNSPEDALAGMADRDFGRYGSFVDTISRRGFRHGYGYDIPGGTRWRGGFPSIYPIAVLVPAESMVLSRTLAANEHVTYTEFIYQPDILDRTTDAVSDPAWNPKDLAGAFARARPRLEPIVRQAVADFRAAYDRANTTLGCGTKAAKPGCDVEVRFLSYVRRGDRQDQMFQAILMSFMLADADPAYVGFHLVGPEGKKRAIDDYDLDMEVIRFIGAKYPRVHKALHTGELTLGRMPPYALVDHMEKAVTIAGAERIGHGTSMAFEPNVVKTLAAMASRNIAVEVNLTSNEGFGVVGSYHPMNLFRAAGVPVTIATDNTGMSRTDLSNEYMRAAFEHKLGYRDLKHIARTGMQVTFLPGASLWQGLKIGTPVAACADSPLGSDRPSASCRAFLGKSEKATAQWRHEKALATFEKDVQSWRF